MHRRGFIGGLVAGIAGWFGVKRAEAEAPYALFHRGEYMAVDGHLREHIDGTIDLKGMPPQDAVPLIGSIPAIRSGWIRESSCCTVSPLGDRVDFMLINRRVFAGKN